MLTKVFAKSSAMAGAEKPLLRRDLECDLCKRVIGVANREFKGNRAEEPIIQALENVCKFVPGKERSKGDEFVEQHTNELISIMAEQVDPSRVCALLGVCLI